eukprot:403338266
MHSLSLRYLLRASSQRTPQAALQNQSLVMGTMIQRLFSSPVNSKLVKQLREMTGSPLKDCMKTLEETNGDLEQAKELLRKRGLADAEKRVGRATAEGFVGMKLDRQSKLLTMIELHCETDFVAKTDKFKEGIERLVETLHKQGPSVNFHQNDISNVDKINALIKSLKLDIPLDHDLKEQTIEEGIKYVISKTQENVRLAKIYQRQWNPSEGEILNAYVHNPELLHKVTIGKIGSSVLMKAEDKKHNAELEALSQQLALHIAAMRPVYLNKQQVPQEVKQKLLEEGPADKALWKMFTKDVLMEQELATSEESLKVKQLIRDRESELGSPLLIKEWTLFNIGA